MWQSFVRYWRPPPVDRPDGRTWIVVTLSIVISAVLLGGLWLALHFG